MPVISTRVCNKCKVTKELCYSNFASIKGYYRHTCRECDRQASKLYQKEHRQVDAVRTRRRIALHVWRESDPKKRQRDRDYAKQRSRKIKSITLKHYGGICVCCGEEEFRLLSIDHIDGRGAEHRRIVIKSSGRPPSGIHMYMWLRKNNFPPGFQVLCFNCNCGRNVNGGVCPHKDLPKQIL